MSYLAMSAAPINNIENTQNYNNDTPIHNKRQAHSKTQKFRQPQSSSEFDQSKVNNVLQSIHNSTPDDDNEMGNYSNKGSSVSAKHSDDFKPMNPYDFPAKPISMGSERTQKEGMSNIDDNLVPKPVDNNDLELQELQSAYMNDAQVRDYYKKLVPNYNHSKFNKSEHNTNYYSANKNQNQAHGQNLSQNPSDSNQVLIEKLNYMINLLEEQQDQKTDSVTEEVVLYSFLGIFIIFIVDSFARVGKYVR